MRGPWHYMTKADWLACLLLIFLSLAGMFLVAAAPTGSLVVVIADGQTRFTASLDQFQETDIEGSPIFYKHALYSDIGQPFR